MLIELYHIPKICVFKPFAKENNKIFLLVPFSIGERPKFYFFKVEIRSVLVF